MRLVLVDWPRHLSPSGLWRRDPLAFAIVVSVLLHALALTLRFAPPAPLKPAPIDPQLEVILLNARTDAKPLQPEVAAQVSMQGGGDRDTGRARSPLPAELQAREGEDLVLRRKRVAELEAQQRKLLALSRGPQALVREGERSDEPRAAASGDDEREVDAVIARLQAQIDRQVSDYNKRPKRLTYGVNAVGVSYARYVDDWAARIEKLGTERYPPEARGRMYDSLIITVEIDKHGNVVDVIVNRKSKYEALNRAVRQIVHAGAPYERFTSEMAREGDILQIVRTWTFTNDTLETASLRPSGAKHR
ncbi:MAG: energy transducer TonB [Burkholderiaceae bacterium]|nr:energy transducer TonB [Burkholderiaceae bacterium]